MLGQDFVSTFPVLAALAVGAPMLLLVSHAWAARALQIVLVLAAAEWLWTLAMLVMERRALGEPWLRLTIILGTVAAFTLAAAIIARPRDR